MDAKGVIVVGEEGKHFFNYGNAVWLLVLVEGQGEADVVGPDHKIQVGLGGDCLVFGEDKEFGEFFLGGGEVEGLYAIDDGKLGTVEEEFAEGEIGEEALVLGENVDDAVNGLADGGMVGGVTGEEVGKGEALDLCAAGGGGADAG